MSLASQKALYGKMAGDTTLTGMLASPPPPNAQSIYYEIAPPAASKPYVIFDLNAGTPDFAMTAKNFDDEVWLVKAVVEGIDPTVASTIKDRLEVLLTDAALSIAGKTHRLSRPTAAVVYAEDVDGQTIRHAGHLFRLIYTAN